MHQKEIRVVVTILSTLVLFLAYALYVYNKHVAGNPEIINDLQFWGKMFLIIIPVMIVALVIIHIIFAIVNKIITNQDIPTRSDEMDKLIELKALRINHRLYMGGVILAMASLALGKEPWVFFIILIAAGLVGGTAEGLAQIYYYRKGV